MQKIRLRGALGPPLPSLQTPRPPPTTLRKARSSPSSCVEEGAAGPGGPGGGGATHQSAWWSWSPSTPLLRRGPRRGRHQGPGTLSCPRLPRSGRPQVNTRLVFTGILGASRPDSSRGRRAPVASSAPSIKPCTGKTHASFTHAGVQVFTGASRAAVLTPWPPCPGGCRAALGGPPPRGTQTQTSRRVGRQRPSRPHCGYRGWLRGARGLAGGCRLAPV